MLRSSREISGRVEIGGHTRPNRFRRATWWLALWSGVGALMWVSFQHVRGESQIYQAGPVTSPHRLIEHDCARCHTTWTPLQRLVSFRDDLHSIDNTKCQTCHRVEAHQKNQIPAHRDISCAACHQEHEGAEMLIRPSSRHCISCHTNLKTTDGPTETFAKHVSRFDDFAGHPEFGLHVLAKNSGSSGELGEKHGARSALQHFQRAGDSEPRWQDKGRIRFNHAAHLKAEYDDQGHLVYGLIGKDKKFTDLSHSCEVCHQPDHERRFMRPIAYDRHCKECHPLLFDQEQFAGQSVPHATPDIVRGFLTEAYTLRVLIGAKAGEVGTSKDSTSTLLPSHQGKGSEEASRSRGFPGHRDFQRLTKAQAEGVLDEVTKAETAAQQHRHSQFGYEATGGCRYCHQVESVESKPAVSLADWQIVPTNIPDRWLIHSEFHHEPHRLLSCSTCHADVGQSKNTGDVLIPTIATCRACHSDHPADWAAALPTRETPSGGNSAHGQTHSLKDLLTRSSRGAGADCIECHRYHDPHAEKLNGPFIHK